MTIHCHMALAGCLDHGKALVFLWPWSCSSLYTPHQTVPSTGSCPQDASPGGGNLTISWKRIPPCLWFLCPQPQTPCFPVLWDFWAGQIPPFLMSGKGNRLCLPTLLPSAPSVGSGAWCPSVNDVLVFLCCCFGAAKPALLTPGAEKFRFISCHHQNKVG